MSTRDEDPSDRPDGGTDTAPIGDFQLGLARSLHHAVAGVPGSSAFVQRWRFLTDNVPGSSRLFRHEREDHLRPILLGSPVQLWSTFSSSYRPEVSIRAVEITRVVGRRFEPLALRIFRYGPGRGTGARASNLVLLEHLSWTCDHNTRAVVFSGEGRVEARFPDFTVSLRDMPRGSRLLYVLSPDIEQDQEPGGAVFDPGCVGKPASLHRLRIIFSVSRTRRGRQENRANYPD